MPRKKSKHRNTTNTGNEEIVFKGEDQHYAHVNKSLGSGRFDITCDDGITRIGKLRGNMRKSQWVTINSLVLVSLREFGDASTGSSCTKADILLKYSDTALKQLKKYGELEWIAERRKETNSASDDEDIAFELEDDDVDINLV